MTDIDWISVDTVCRRIRPLKLRPAENRAVIRRLDECMIGIGEWNAALPPGTLTSKQVAEMLMTDERSVIRWRKALPPATKATCAVCGAPMWVRHDGTIELHATPIFHTCDGKPREVAAS